MLNFNTEVDEFPRIGSARLVNSMVPMVEKRSQASPEKIAKEIVS